MEKEEHEVFPVKNGSFSGNIPFTDEFKAIA